MGATGVGCSSRFIIDRLTFFSQFYLMQPIDNANHSITIVMLFEFKLHRFPGV